MHSAPIHPPSNVSSAVTSAAFCSSKAPSPSTFMPMPHPGPYNYVLWEAKPHLSLYLLQAVRGEGCAPSCSPTQISYKRQKPELALTTRKRIPESGTQWILPQEQNHRPLCLNIRPPYKHTLVPTGHKIMRKRENNPSSVAQNVTYRSSQADCQVRDRG